jgi:chromosomal replication initiator protein
MMEFGPAWDECKALLAGRLPPDDTAAWLSGLTLIALEPRRVVLGGLPNAFFKARVEQQFRATVLDCLARAFPGFRPEAGARLDCRVGGAAALQSALPPAAPGLAAPRPAPHGDQMPLPLAPEAGEESPGEDVLILPAPGAATFDDLIEGAGNRLALQLAREMAAAPGRRYNPLFIHGPTGAGKTHLMRAIAHELRRAHPELNALLVSGESFKVEVLEAIQARRMKPVREKYRSARALLVDGFEFLLITPKAQEELLHAFDALHAEGRQLVIAADRLPQAMSGINETLRSRLEMGLITELALPDEETRLRMVRARAQREGIALGASVAEFLAGRIENPRQMIGALVRLAAYSALLRQPVTLEFTREFAAPFLGLPPRPGRVPLAPEAVVGRVCERLAVHQRALRSRGKSAALVRARQVITYLLKDLAGLSYSEISRWVGNRAVSTLSHGYHQVLDGMEQSPHLRRMVLQLRQELLHGATGGKEKTASAPDEKWIS